MPVERGRARRCRSCRTALIAGAGVLLLVMASPGRAQAPGTALKPELTRVVKMPGLVRETRLGGERRSVFRTQDGRWSAVLLQNQILADLEDRKGVLQGQLLVVATGVVTQYRGRNYLLLTGVNLMPVPAEE